MTTPSGAIAFSQINQELGRSGSSQLSTNDSDLRVLAYVGTGQNTTANTQISINNLRNKAKTFVTVGSNQINYNWQNAIAYNYVAGRTWARVTINSGVVLGSDNVDWYGLYIAGNSGDYFELVNNGGYIVGRGGDGGKGSGGSGYNRGYADSGWGGQHGGHAMYVGYPTSIWNYGAIWSGGGGGGGGPGSNTGGKSRGPSAGGGGGGGAGYYGGSGGPGGSSSESTGAAGGGGSLGAGGGGSGGGGGGGGPGADGGGTSFYGGGSAGYWAIGSGNVSWGNVGDVRGYAG